MLTKNQVTLAQLLFQYPKNHVYHLIPLARQFHNCGMVYMQPHELGWQPLFTSWKNKLPAFFRMEGNEKLLSAIDELVEIIVQPLLSFIRDGEVVELT